jgi:hypothetical protein
MSRRIQCYPTDTSDLSNASSMPFNAFQIGIPNLSLSIYKPLCHFILLDL